MLKKILLFLLLTMLMSDIIAERLGMVSTKFRVLGPNDKIVIEAFDDPGVSGVTCYLSRAKTGGMSGAVGLAEDTSDASIASDRPTVRPASNPSARAVCSAARRSLSE